MQWDFDIIASVIAEAEETGQSVIELSSPREAALFRYAINNNRRLKNLGKELTTKVRGRTVIVFKKPQIEILDLGTEYDDDDDKVASA